MEALSGVVRELLTCQMGGGVELERTQPLVEVGRNREESEVVLYKARGDGDAAVRPDALPE